MKAILMMGIFLFPFLLNGQIAMVTSAHGETILFDVKKEETLEQIVARTEGFTPKHLIIDLDQNHSQVDFEEFELKKHGHPLPHPRHYQSDVTAAERNDIHYIVTTLANSSLISIAIHRSSLESAGDRIDHVHPLRFLLTVFSNEELKVGLRNIRGRGWIWGDFLSGIKQSLITEAAGNNMKRDFIVDFALKLEIDPNYLMPSVQNNNWEEFIEVLITRVPRKGDHERYDS